MTEFPHAALELGPQPRLRNQGKPANLLGPDCLLGVRGERRGESGNATGDKYPPVHHSMT
jgi:hypothetical protein